MREHLTLMKHGVDNLHEDMQENEVDKQFTIGVKNISNNISYILNLKK